MGTSNHTSNIKVNNLCYQSEICKKKLAKGSLTGKIPVIVDDRTTIYVNPKLSKDEIQAKIDKYRENMAVYK